MPVPIPYALDYTATANGAVWKVVKCDSCGKGFAYLMQRSAAGGGTSFLFLDNAGAKERAKEQAAQNLAQTLETEFDAIPCPHCGRYQEFMLWAVRWQRWKDSPLWWLGLLLLGGLLFGVHYLFAVNTSPHPDLPMWRRVSLIAAVVPCVLGIAWLIRISIRWIRFDPNNLQDHEERLKVASISAVSGPEVEQILIDAREKLIRGPNSR